ncbi:MAG: FecR domain-containing protein [Cryobacterium sp.]|nr:FecR domain-containing protein [Oligoflexia bacterium]
MRTTVSISLLVVTLFASQAFAANDSGIVKMISVSPSTTFEGRHVAEDAVIGTLGTIKTGADGGAVVKILKNGVILNIAYGAELKIVRPSSGDPSDVIELVDGAVHVVVPELKVVKSAAPKMPFTLRTKAVTMGVRGTDFLGIVNPVLDESEIIVFKGKVEFKSAADPSDLRLVNPGYWGGLGGRFGSKIHELIKLPESALAHYAKVGMDVPSYSEHKTGEPAKTSEPSR